jgi:hypothetical protein
MKTLIAWACAAAVVCALTSKAADAAMIVVPAVSVIAPGALVPDDLLNVTFWAQPYPHGYSGWRRCPHGVRVQTPYGWRCSTALYRERGPVLRSRG